MTDPNTKAGNDTEDTGNAGTRTIDDDGTVTTTNDGTDTGTDKPADHDGEDQP